MSSRLREAGRALPFSLFFAGWGKEPLLYYSVFDHPNSLPGPFFSLLLLPSAFSPLL